MILVAAEQEDIHARRVASLLQAKGHPVSFIYATDFGVARTLSFCPESGAGVIKDRSGFRINADDVSAVWYRRPGRPQASQDVSDRLDRAFAETEWQHAIDGFFSLLNACVVSPPFLQRAAIKPRQLAAARGEGLRVPETLITNDVDEALAFVEEHGRVIHKASSSPPHRFLDTRTWGVREKECLQDIPICPIILQEQIDGPSDVRVTIVGRRLFAARIDRGSRYPGPDSRLDLDANCQSHSLPDEISCALLRVMDTLGLMFASVDLKLTDALDYVFFEGKEVMAASDSVIQWFPPPVCDENVLRPLRCGSWADGRLHRGRDRFRFGGTHAVRSQGTCAFWV
jgi:hypothetical protein